MIEIASFNPLLDQSLVEGVLIAAYFHDLGMVRSTREEHGILGREDCDAYFEKHTLTPPSRFGEILGAIEEHDNKEDKRCSVIHPEASPGILDILTIADDLEALGIIGIYRYIEIYLTRNITLGNLGTRILGNVRARFKNITDSCINCSMLISEYRLQYSTLVSFFDSYNQQLLTEPHPEKVFHGHLGIVNYIRSLSIEGHIRPENFISEPGMNKAEMIVTSYFTALNNELVKARL